jgi:hypothetical protein
MRVCTPIEFGAPDRQDSCEEDAWSPQLLNACNKQMTVHIYDIPLISIRCNKIDERWRMSNSSPSQALYRAVVVMIWLTNQLRGIQWPQVLDTSVVD